MRLNNKTYHFPILMLLFSVVGCCPVKRTASHTDYTVMDSIWTVEKERWVPLKVPARKIEYTLRVECDPVTNKPVVKQHTEKGENMSSTANIDDNGLLTVTARCDSLQELIAVKDTEINRLRKEETIITKVVEVPRPVAWYDKVCRWFTGVVGGGGLLFLAFKFIKPI